MKLLFVDDEPRILSGIRRALYQTGWKISIADGPEAALAAIETLQPDVVISDAMMPVMNGVELLELIGIRWPRIARYVLSGQAEESIVLKGSQVTHGWFTKPCSHALLSEQLLIVEQVTEKLPAGDIELTEMAAASPLFSSFSLLKQYMQCIDGEIRTLGSPDISKLSRNKQAALEQVASAFFPGVDGAQLSSSQSLSEAGSAQFPLLLITEIVLREPGLLDDPAACQQIAAALSTEDETDPAAKLAWILSNLKGFFHAKMPTVENVTPEGMMLYMMHIWNLPYSVIHRVACKE